ncbi:hypothetical protein [Occallatibacter riparius]|uniref:Uncharacterized protein n=1 Tax=Occallatibacter riparius TaxID=1002689 RepID=A0A9J7BPA6_9BACT|nr:hypothetical protein [Occallatibacter riparius]UWZ84361.1 hypothetical protein MOP44_00150 [Occallatibacter riparius]
MGLPLPIKFILAAFWGSLMALLTLLEGPLSVASDNQFYVLVERCLFWLIMPGVVIGTTAGSFSLAICANAAFHFSLCWLLLRIFLRERKRPEQRESIG